MIADRVEKAKQELLDFCELTTNDVDNKDEILLFAKEIAEGGQGLFQCFKGLSKEDAAKAGAVIGAAVAGHYAEEMVVFSDGSTMQNLAPAG